jgi:hypothetical protein
MKYRSIVFNAVIAFICGLLIVQPAFAQQSQDTFGLKVKIENGDNGSTAVKMPATDPIVVVVVDANDQPVQGALVVFTAPDQGAGGVFENENRTITVTTDRNGRATASGYKANSTAGSYQIDVRTQLLNETANAEISHTNVASGKKNTKLIAILAIAGAGAAGALIKVAGGGGSGGGTNNGGTGGTVPTITFGGSTVGAPQ